MRKAIREGLPLVESGGGDMLKLDGELSADVDRASKETELRRSKILLEAIRTGLHAFVSRTISEKENLANVQDPEQKTRLLQMLEESYKQYDDPMVREHRRLILERSQALTRLNDLLENVPEAKRRSDLVNRLAEFRRQPGGGAGGRPMLSNEELAWQVAMCEKYGADHTAWPEKEKMAHAAARKAENKI
jgi:hypothetical protein